MRTPGKERQRPAANFSAFFKRSEQAHTPARQAASFSSFLRKQPNQAQAQPAAAAAAAPAGADCRAAADAGPAPEQKPVAVLYGTEYGFSKEIAEKLVGKLKDCGQFWYAPSIC